MRRKQSHKKHWFLKTLLSVIVFSIFFVFIVYFVSFLLGPPDISNARNTVYYSEDGKVIGEEKGKQNRDWIHLKDMSPHIINATILTEDQHFYKHNGFDVPRIAGAAFRDIVALSKVEGASTITQQYARNLYLTTEKTWSRKLKEAFYTIRLEMYYSKDEILEGYLNTIYYGHGAYGIEAASNYYFNKSASDLSLAEAAMLAGIPKGPTYYSPFNDLQRATSRQHLILKILLKEGKITKEAYQVALHEDLQLSKTPEKKPTRLGPYFQDVVLKEAADILNLDMEAIRSGGYKIHTTLNVNAQKQLERAMNETLDQKSKIEIGVLAMDPITGAIKALTGGRDYTKSSFNRAISAKRMPGSTFKPFLYYAALNNGYNATLKMISKPTAFQLANGEVYQPSNYNGYYANKPITMAQAIALSDNIYAVKTALYLGIDRLIDTARNFGITSELPKVPSLALGTASVSVLEMVRGYGMLANGGQEISGHTINKITDHRGNVIYEHKKTSGEQVLDPKKAFILTQLMTGMFDETLNGYMPVTGSTIANKLTRTYAGKSGTTDSDSWMIGYSPSLVTGIWTGYDDNRSIDIVKEKKYAKEIWARFMEAVHKEQEATTFSQPKGVIGIPIDPETGQRATPYCSKRTVMYFERGTEPEDYCTVHYHHQHDKQKRGEGIFKKWFDTFFR